MRVGLVVLWAAVAAIVLFFAGVFGMLAITRGSDTAPGTSTATPSPQASIDTSYAVMVLNGTADATQNDLVKNTIVSAGWAEGAVSVGKATADDFPETVVYYAQEADRSAALGLAQALGVTNVAQSDAYQQSGDADVKELVVVIGLDLTSAK